MPKYVALVSVWVTVNADDSDHADRLLKTEFVDQAIAIGTAYDSPFDVQLEFINIEESR